MKSNLEGDIQDVGRFHLKIGNEHPLYDKYGSVLKRVRTVVGMLLYKTDNSRRSAITQMVNSLVK